MTLIELVTAMAIGLIIAGVAFSVYFTFQGTLKKQRLQRESWIPLSSALEILRRDLSGTAMIPGREKEQAFILENTVSAFSNSMNMVSNGMPGTIRLIFATLQYGKPDSLEEPLILTAVEHRFECNAQATSDIAWVRRAYPFDSTPPTETNGQDILAGHLRTVSVEVFAGSQWMAQWDSRLSTNIPSALRIHAEGHEPLTKVQTTLLIPAGITLRSAAPASQSPSTRRRGDRRRNPTQNGAPQDRTH